MSSKHNKLLPNNQTKNKFTQQQDHSSSTIQHKKKVFCGDHLEEVVYSQYKENGSLLYQYCKQCLGIQAENSSIESSFKIYLENSQNLLLNANQAIKNYASLYTKSTKLINTAVRDIISSTKKQVMKIIDDFFNHNHNSNFKNTMFGEQLNQLEHLQNQYFVICSNLSKIQSEANDNWTHASKRKIVFSEIIKFNLKINEYKQNIDELSNQYKVLEKNLLNMDKINEVKNQYRDHIQEQLCWHISSQLNHSPIKRRDDCFQSISSYIDEDTEQAKRLVTKLNFSSVSKSKHHVNIIDSFRVNQSLDSSLDGGNNSIINEKEGNAELKIYRQAKSIQSIDDDDYDDDMLEHENPSQKEAFTSYLDAQLERIHKMQNPKYVSISPSMNQPSNDFDFSSHNQEIQRLKDIVQREEENSKQRIIKLQKQKVEEMEKFKNVSTVKFQLQSMIKKDLYYIKGESQEVFIYDFATKNFKNHKFDSFTQKFPKNFSSIQRLNRDIYIFGGIYQRSKYSQKTLQIKLNQNKYKQQVQEKAQMLAPKINIPVCLIKNKYVYLCGGFYKQMLVECDIYSIDEDRWFDGPKLNYPRANCSLCPFDDRFIYIFTGKANESNLFIEKLDAGLHGSSNLMKSIDEDLSLSLAYKWEVIELQDKKEFIQNMHFNGVMQISSKEILIFGGTNRQTFKCEIDFKKNSHKLEKLDDKYNLKQLSKFVYEKDFIAIIRKNILFAIDPNYKTMHILDLESLVESKQNNNESKISQRIQRFEEEKKEDSRKSIKEEYFAKTMQNKLMSPVPSRKVTQIGKKPLKKSFNNEWNSSNNINLSLNANTESGSSVWDVKTFKDVGINILSGDSGAVVPQVNSLMNYQTNMQSQNRQQSSQPLFNIKEARTMSRGNQNTLGLENSVQPKHRLSHAVMQHRNRVRSIQSAGKPQGYLQYPGQLPTLGLNKYKNTEINNGENTKNPFSIQKETEKLLIARERERENKDFNRVQNDVLRVYQKNIQTRQNRAGVIREINDIKPTKGSKYGTENQLMLMNASYDDQQQQQNKKLNIFDENDSSLLKHETLARLGFEARGAIMSAVDEDSETKSLRSQHSSQTQLALQKPKALEYLQKGREQKESTRDFILNARNILISQIAINDKTEETERLKEYIIMEKEKLEEAKKTFDEDKDKFQKYMDDLNRKAEETALDVQRLTNEKNEKMERIQQLQINIQKKKSKIKQIDEKLVVFKQHKQFLDTLAISAGKKQPRTAAQRAELGLEGKSEHQIKQSRISRKEPTGNFFLTQTNQQQHQGTKQKTSMDKQDPENEDAHLLEEDDDFEIYFDKYTLLEHLSHLEEDNLFKIHLVQEDEQALDKLKRSIDYKIQMKEQEIEDVKANIEMLVSSMNQLINKQQFLDSTMRVKQNSNQQNNQLNTSKGGATQNDISRISNIQETYNERGSSMAMLQQMTGCSKEQINKLSILISQLLEKAGIKQEDQSDKIEMLRKIDYKLEQLVEVRDYIFNGEKRKELEDKEKELHMIRKEENIKKKKAFEDKKLEEGQRKNRERIRKQEQFKIFRGRKEMQRAKKADLKPKEKNDDKPSQEVLDQLRYLGNKIFEEEKK